MKIYKITKRHVGQAQPPFIEFGRYTYTLCEHTAMMYRLMDYGIETHDLDKVCEHYRGNKKMYTYQAITVLVKECMSYRCAFVGTPGK